MNALAAQRKMPSAGDKTPGYIRQCQEKRDGEIGRAALRIDDDDDIRRAIHYFFSLFRCAG